MRPMRPFNFNTSAELFPAAIRKKKRAGFAYRRFLTNQLRKAYGFEGTPVRLVFRAHRQKKKNEPSGKGDRKGESKTEKRRSRRA